MVTIVTVVTMAGVSFVFLVCVEIGAVNRLHMFPQRARIGVALCATGRFAGVRLLHTQHFTLTMLTSKLFISITNIAATKGIIDSNLLPSSLPTLQLPSHHCHLHHLH